MTTRTSDHGSNRTGGRFGALQQTELTEEGICVYNDGLELDGSIIDLPLPPDYLDRAYGEAPDDDPRVVGFGAPLLDSLRSVFGRGRVERA